MFTMKMDDILVMLAEDILAVDRGVVIGEEAIDVFFVIVGDAVELVCLHFFEMADYFWCDGEGGIAITARVEELESAFVQDVFMLGKVECGVYADTFENTMFLTVVFIENYMMTSHLRHHRCIHTTHTGAHNHFGSQVGG